MPTWKRAIVVGASSGIGQAVAQQLLEAGTQVACVSRRGTCPPGGLAFAHDVRDTEAVPALFAEMTQQLGGLDLIVYASGIMPKVAPDEYSTQKDADQIAVNLTGAIAWLNPAAARFAKARAGTIVGISSVAGDRGRRGNPVYGATKAALNAYLESLRNRIERTGAFVVTVKPGPVETPMTAGLKMPGMIPADQAAREILAAAKSKVRIAYVPGKWRVIMTVIRAIPAPIFKYLNL